MARKPNFNFERMGRRDKAKAAKNAEKAKAKSAKKSGADEAVATEPPSGENG